MKRLREDDPTWSDTDPAGQFTLGPTIFPDKDAFATSAGSTMRMAKRIHEGYRVWGVRDLIHHFVQVAESFRGDDDFARTARNTVQDVAQEMGLAMTMCGDGGRLKIEARLDRAGGYPGYLVRSKGEIADAVEYRVGELQDQGLDVNTPQGTALLKIARRFRIIE